MGPPLAARGSFLRLKAQTDQHHQHDGHRERDQEQRDPTDRARLQPIAQAGGPGDGAMEARLSGRIADVAKLMVAPLCVLKTRFCNNDDEVRRGQA